MFFRTRAHQRQHELVRTCSSVAEIEKSKKVSNICLGVFERSGNREGIQREINYKKEVSR